MSDLDKFRIEQEARRRSGDPHRASPYTEAINRYLGVSSYVDPYAARPAKPPATPAGTVVTGVAGPPAGQIVVDQAAIEAGLRGYALVLAHAGALPHDPGMFKRLIDHVHAFAPDLVVTTRVTVGMNPAELLLSAAGDADLIVVGQRHGMMPGALWRSVADRVAAEHPGPVLVVREAGWPPAPEQAARPLLVGMNASAASTRAAEFAVAEAAARGCDVVLLHVTREPTDAIDWTDRRGGVSVRNRSVAGNAVNEIVDASRHAAAVVLGRDAARGRLGPVQRAVLRHAHCPVFFVR